MNDVKRVFRNFSLPVDTFDHLKTFQRDYERRKGIRLSNSQILAIIIRQHRELSTVGDCYV